MTTTTAVRVLGALALLTTLVGCTGVLNFVRTSPDGRYVTVLAADETRSKLLLYDLETCETTEVYATQSESLEFYDIQWRPDSQAFCFVTNPEPEQARLMLYELGSHRLTELPVELPELARWSRDGNRLLVRSSTEEARRYDLYDTASWQRVRSYPGLIRSIVGSDTAVLYVFRDERVLALGNPDTRGDDFPQGSNLYLFSGSRWQPYTTTGDVITFWVAPDESRVRWVRLHGYKWLAVFESPLAQRTPRRLALLEDSTFTEEGYAYRFSPDGTKLAWGDAETVYVLNLKNDTVRRLTMFDLQPQKVAPPQEGASASRRGVMGFDWRDNDTLVIQRGNEIEQVSVQVLSQ